MIQVTVVGDKEAAFLSAKKGFVVLGVETTLEEEVRRAGGTFIYFGTENGSVRVHFENMAEALTKAIESSDIVIIGGGPYAEIAKKIAGLLNKPYVEGKGKEVVDKALEKLVRFNLFGKK